MEALMVEVLNRFGQVRSRHRLTHFPATLGRRLDNDVILDEPDVSALHARIVREADGSLTLQDAGSSNGVRVARKKVASASLQKDTVARLGSAKLRFRSVDEPVPKTGRFRLRALDRWSAVALTAAVWVLAEVIDEWYLPSTRVRISEVAETLASVTVVVGGGWTFVWSLASRIAHGKPNVKGHLTAALGALAGLTLARVVTPYLCTVLRLGRWPSFVATGVAFALVTGWPLFQSLSRVVSWSTRRLGAAVAGVLCLGATVAVVSSVASANRYSAGLPMDETQVPPALFVGPVWPEADLAQRIDRLRHQVDEAKRDP